ncbi:AI-2E family transporter [Geobacillus sp. WSUCF-018B]|uniref:AI-2E family transporter n=1 Tax=Geobacillus sp. WSUCF-018B TaxID=2055939 RepID=UPI000C2821E5|nr:AI-2E family transporter [Geobacillus sp. WSUCF-018B]PJW17499.1 AI-2E family transporter [Geobacillus sp. WSUCF-018B]
MGEQQWLSFLRIGKWLLVTAIVYLIVRMKDVWWPVVDFVATALAPFLLAAFITYLLHPLVEFIHRKGVPRALAILLIYVLFFGAVGYGLYRGVPLFIAQLRELDEQLPSLMDTYRRWARHVHDETSTWPMEVHTRIEAMFVQLEEAAAGAVTMAIDAAKSFIGSAATLLLIPFIVFYMLKDIEVLKRAVWYMTPKRWREPGMAFLKDVDESLGGYIRGQLFVCAAIGLAAALGLWLAGMDYPLLLGFIIGLTNIIPYFGPLLGAIPAVILAATISLKMVIIVLIIIFALQFLEGNVLSPLIVGKSVHMHPLAIMLALFAGGELAGVPGLILAVPTAAVLKVAVSHWKEHYAPH